jgi:2-polyprenyl-3-methyl-5-hydroxy-6-metoxy-1,4-benzoquinol methylase
MSQTNFIEREDCPVCHSKQTEKLYECAYTESPIKDVVNESYIRNGMFTETELQGGVYILEQCSQCKLVYQKQIPDEQLTEMVYSGDDLPDVMKYKSQFKIAIYTQNLLSLLELYKKENRKPVLLDFGMGWGSWAQIARAFGCEVYGFEISERQIKYSESFGIKTLKYEQIAEREFDFIHTEHVFEHVPDPDGILAHLVKSLKNGGLIKLNVPNGKAVKKHLGTGQGQAAKFAGRRLNPVYPLEHINCFNHKSLTALAKQNKLKPFKIPMCTQYSYLSPWGGIKQKLSNYLMPVRKNWINNGTDLMFRKPQ